MAGRVGATPEQLTTLAGQFKDDGDRLMELLQTIIRQAEGTDWEGQAREKFLQDLKGPFTQAVKTTVENLGVAATEAKDRAEKFRIAGY